MKKVLLIALAACLSATSAFAGHVDTYGIGSRAVAMGGAMTAGTNDAFSVYYNPAAMSKFKKKTFTVGTHFVDPRLKIKDFNAEMTTPNALTDAMTSNPSADEISDQAPLLIVPHMGYVHPVNDKIALGVAFYVPYGLSLEWDRNTAANPAAYNTYKSYYVREVITPSISYKANDKLSFGFGVSIGKTKAGSERIRYVPEFMQSAAVYQAQGYTPTQAAMVAAAYQDLNGSQYQTHMEDSFNYSFNFGVLYEMSDKVTLGATFRSRADTNLEGDVDVRPVPTYWQNYNQDASTDVDTPDQIQVGIEYRPTDKWKVNFDITRTFWSRIEEYTVAFDEPFMATPGIAPTGVAEEYFNREWKDSWQVRLGTEYALNKTVDLRAGYYYDQGVVPDSTMDVQWPDSDKHVLSGGIGLNFGQVTVDLALQYIMIKDINISAGESENLDHTFYRPVHSGDVSLEAGGSVLGYGVTVSYKF